MKAATRSWGRIWRNERHDVHVNFGRDVCLDFDLETEVATILHKMGQ